MRRFRPCYCIPTFLKPRLRRPKIVRQARPVFLAPEILAERARIMGL